MTSEIEEAKALLTKLAVVSYATADSHIPIKCRIADLMPAAIARIEELERLADQEAEVYRKNVQLVDELETENKKLREERNRIIQSLKDAVP